MGTTPSLTKSKIIKDIKYPTTIKEYINEKLNEDYLDFTYLEDFYHNAIIL